MQHRIGRNGTLRNKFEFSKCRCNERIRLYDRSHCYQTNVFAWRIQIDRANKTHVDDKYVWRDDCKLI